MNMLNSIVIRYKKIIGFFLNKYVFNGTSIVLYDNILHDLFIL